MIQILDERTLINAYKIKLETLLRLSRDELVAESYNYNSQTTRMNFSVALRGNVANSALYMRSWANLKQQTNRVVLGLESAESELRNVFDGYKNSVKNFSKLKLRLQKENYLNRKRLKIEEGTVKRYQSFRQQDLSNVDTLKHPKLIDYYFNKDSLCSVEDGLISLPAISSRMVKIKEASIEGRFSTAGASKEPVENIKTDFSSHQYICRLAAPEALGAKLTYCLEFSKESNFDKITILDASINFAEVSQLFVIVNNNIVDIDYTAKQVDHKKVLYINDPDILEAKKIYITFSQSKYIDISQPGSSLRAQIISSSDNSFEIIEDLSTSYIYEFNIDSIVVEQSVHQNIGMFRLSETIDVRGKSLLSVNWKAIFEDRFSAIEVFIEGTYKDGNLTGTEVITVEEYSEINVSRYDSISLILILNADNAFYSGYIESIDIKAV